MNQKIADGIYLNLLPTQQFKTLRISMQFITPVTADNLTKRSLLANVLSASSQRYKDQVAIANELEAMYGARFNMNTYRQGNLAIFTVNVQVVSAQYLKDQADLQHQAWQFIQELLQHPDVQADAFNPVIFKREKENLQRYLMSVADDKQTYAALALQSLYFDQEAQQLPSFGTADQIADLTAQALYQTYQTMLQTDRIQMTVIGNADEAQLASEITAFHFGPRADDLPAFFYQQAHHEQVREKREQQPIQQGKLNLAYQVPTYFYQPNYFAMVMTNALFGGTALSLLFTNVREKASLAYYASSQYDGFRGLVTVQTGIESGQKARVLAIIEAQRQTLIDGTFTQTMFEQTKLALINQFKASLDSPARLGQQQFNHELVTATILDAEQFSEAILAVSRAEVQAQAEQMQLQAVYFLEGEHE